MSFVDLVCELKHSPPLLRVSSFILPLFLSPPIPTSTQVLCHMHKYSEMLNLQVLPNSAVLNIEILSP